MLALALAVPMGAHADVPDCPPSATPTAHAEMDAGSLNAHGFGRIAGAYWAVNLGPNSWMYEPMTGEVTAYFFGVLGGGTTHLEQPSGEETDLSGAQTIEAAAFAGVIYASDRYFPTCRGPDGEIGGGVVYQELWLQSAASGPGEPPLAAPAAKVTIN